MSPNLLSNFQGFLGNLSAFVGTYKPCVYVLSLELLRGGWERWGVELVSFGNHES